VNFGFVVTDTDGLRPSPSVEFRIGAEGLRYFPQATDTCTFAQANRQANTPARACRAARIGGGIARAWTGSQANRAAPPSSQICNLKVTLINITGPGISRKRGGLAVRLDADVKTITDPNSREFGCPLAIHQALKGTMHNVRIAGHPASELRFTVPDNLAHPVAGLETSVVESNTKVRRTVGRVRIKGETRRVGVYSSIGCTGQRLSRVTFIAENGSRVTATENTNTCTRR
jgi:hypothetical protein